MLKTAVFAMLGAIALSAQAQSPKPADVWFGGGHIVLSVTDAAGAFSAQWQFDRADNGDVRIIKEERRGSTKVSGTLMSVCDDQALLLKDIVPARQLELQELNEPVLNLQLVLRLLARAMPQGLPAAGAQTAIDTGDDKTTLRVRKAYSARKDFGAPWRARGIANRSAAGDVKFELVLTYATENAPDKQSELKLGGVWQQESRVKSIDNSFALAGWRVHRVDTIAEVVGGNTVLDPVAMTTPLQFATVGELRERIGRWWHTDARAPKRAECKL
jgi:hypothetical protein